MAAGIAMGASLGFYLGLIALVVSLLLWIYSAWLKRTPLVGNVLIAICASATLLYGALAVGEALQGVIPALFAFAIHLGREIVKDCEDLEGDRYVGARTLPIAIGMRGSQKIAAIVLILLTITLPVPYFIRMLNVYYLSTAICFVGIPLLAIVFLLIRGLGHAGLGRASMVLKLCMIGGLISLYVG
jgi:4-hydroxybenzoate polyprenyltransferase